MFLGSQNGSEHFRRTAQQTRTTRASAELERWPRTFLEDAKKMTDDAVLMRGESITRHIRQKIAIQHDLLRHNETPIRSDYSSATATYTVFASTLLTASLAEVLNVFSCDAQLGFQAFLARIFGAELIEVKTARRLATGVAPCVRDDDDDSATVVSDVPSSQSDRDEVPKRSLAGAIKHAKFETKRFFSRTRHDLVFLDAMQQPSPSSVLRAFKSLDNPLVYRMVDAKCKLQHVTSLLFGYHIEDVGSDRVQMAFYGNHFGPKPSGSSSPGAFGHHVLHRLAKGLAILADAVVRRRLAAHITTVDATALHSDACTRCLKRTPLRKQVVCRLCGLNFCHACSSIERVESTNGVCFELRVCRVCYEQCKAKYILTNKVLATTSLTAAATPVAPTGSMRRPSARQQRVSRAGKQLVQALKHSKIATHEELLHRISELSEDGSSQSFCQTDVMQLLQSLPEESTTPRNLRHSFMTPKSTTPTSSSSSSSAPMTTTTTPTARPKIDLWTGFRTPRGSDYKAQDHSGRFDRLSSSESEAPPRPTPPSTLPSRASMPQPKTMVMPTPARTTFVTPPPTKASAVPPPRAVSASSPRTPMGRTRSSIQMEITLQHSQEAEQLRQNIFVDHEMNAVLDAMCESLVQDVEVAQAYVCVVYKGQCILKAAFGDNVPHMISPACALNLAVLSSRTPMFVSDASVDARFAASPRVTGAENIRFFYGVPLVTSDGIELGTLSIADDMPRGRMAATAKDKMARVAADMLALMEQRSRVALL
ncbi:hypothetical protein SDRG_00219 [Saprolegnia diclina VS20]|uniref:FYVE-type domain-containing protein n=1 Tax=Saprolegnia diclina (strain VS20) TaxID=1156394 RepID=T0R6F8_SAPDV|nr:hypothetical protein SDRG_00219 [Saprolegnia diclina VS20]EQC42486.1 hypothetical protein SDRG_00219 [Saprolegnia diclina VS20]|eukprot:XP_008603909.1 hypothetical protein SDRG_00219 [Saprolegnia diclina VS20]